MAMRTALPGAALCAVLLVMPASALADTVIPAGRSVAEVTVLGDDVRLDGTSQGSVIVVGGNLSIGPSGKALHGVTVIGGSFDSEPNSMVVGDVFQLGTTLPDPSGRELVGLLLLALAIRSAVVWLILRVSRLLAGLSTSQAMFADARVRPLRSVAVGALVLAGILAAGILLALTVVGLVFTAAFAAVLLLGAALGVAFALTGAPRGSERANTVTLAVMFPVIGDALLALATVVALGAAFHHLVDRRSAAPAVASNL
jgi:hypothetical protein